MQKNVPQKKLLDPATIERAERLGLQAKMIVEGYMAGEHRSPYRGFAIEFAQHRQYTPGDDTKHLDWKVLGKSDRYYIKQYEQETNFIAHVVLDGSRSMQYGSGSDTKFEYAKRLAACLCYLVLLQRDATALAIVDETIQTYLTRTDNLASIHKILAALAGFEPTGATNLPVVLTDLARQVKRKGIFIVISDFFDDVEQTFRSIQHLRFNGHEVIVFHVLDPYELTFPLEGNVEFLPLEDGQRIVVRPAEIKRAYLTEFKAFLESVISACERNRCDYVRVDTSHRLHETLSGYLAFRQRTRK
jgi:uncharacterized protein (DUF58 family)